MINIAVLASGSGTILQAIINHGVPLGLVLADKPCKALEIAKEASVPIVLIDRRDFGYRPGVGEQWDRKGFTHKVSEDLKSHGIDVVAMAGFFTILHDVIFDHFGGPILNIHPSLLPAFKGEFAVRDALAAGVTETGTTIHLATERLDDERYIIEQVSVPVESGDTVETLWERIKVQERDLYPRVLSQIYWDETITLTLNRMEGR